MLQNTPLVKGAWISLRQVSATEHSMTICVSGNREIVPLSYLTQLKRGWRLQDLENGEIVPRLFQGAGGTLYEQYIVHNGDYLVLVDITIPFPLARETELIAVDQNGTALKTSTPAKAPLSRKELHQAMAESMANHGPLEAAARLAETRAIEESSRRQLVAMVGEDAAQKLRVTMVLDDVAEAKWRREQKAELTPEAQAMLAHLESIGR